MPLFDSPILGDQFRDDTPYPAETRGMGENFIILTSTDNPPV